MSPQMAWPTEIKDVETDDYKSYNKIYESNGNASGFQEMYGDTEKSTVRDSLPPSDNPTINFKHDLHRGL